MEALFVEQKKLAKELSTLTTNLRKLPIDRRTTEAITSKQVEADAAWKKFDQNNTLILQQDQELIKTQPYVTEKTYDKTKSGYIDFYKYFDSFAKAIAEDETKQKRIRKTLSIKRNMFLESITVEIADMTLGELEAKLEITKFEWNEYRSCFLTSQESTNATYDGDEYRATHDLYVSTVGKIQNEIKRLTPRNGNGAINNREKLADLPKIKIPEFDGRVSNWTTFYELFDQIVHKNTDVSNATKMQYLKTFIKGDAARLIHHIQPTGENYENAYEILKKRYENTRVLLGKLLDSIINLPSLQQETCAGLKSMHDTIYECLMGIRNLGINTENWDALLTHMLIKKLDKETRKNYECQLTDPREPQGVTDFLNYIEARFMALEAYEPVSINGGSQQQTKNTNDFKKSKQTKCSNCQGEHNIFKCEEFKKLTEQERFNMAKTKRLCMRCLREGHKSSECKMHLKCATCQKTHNTLVHLNENNWKNSNKKPAFPPNRDASQQNVNTLLTMENADVLLATAMVNIKSKNNMNMMFKAVIDQGSQSSFITENAAQMLGLRRTKVSATITGIGANEKTAKYMVSLKIHPHFSSDFKLETEAIVLERIMNNTPIGGEQQWNHIRQLTLADPNFGEDCAIDILLGAADYAQIIRNGLIRGNIGEPIAQNTEFGWIVSGQIKRKDTTNNIDIVSLITTAEIDEKLSALFECNELQDDKEFTQEENRCEEHFMRTTERRADGRYIVKLLFITGDFPDIGQSRNCAAATLLQMEKKFAKNPAFFEQYKAFIDEYLRLGHMQPANNSDAGMINYLPHHAVFKESTTTKLRVVFDASRKTSNGKSLNDNMVVGPTIQGDMPSLIIRWRKHKIAFTADVEKMYRQILVNDEQTNLQRILWRNSPNEKMKEYKLTTITYGTSSAPYLAIRTLQQLGKDEAENYPNAAQIILNDFYVDDVASGADTAAEAIELRHELKNALNTGGLNLRKWASNSEELMAAIPASEREIEYPLNIKNTIKTLGIKWNPTSDTFSYRINVDVNIDTTTKRQLLSEIASLYDPLGWLAPVIIKPKIIIQNVWAIGLSWDDKLPDDIKSKWQRIKNELMMVEHLNIPRWLHTTRASKFELHGFCDASEAAYAAVIYIKTIENESSIRLIAAKAKVAPLKKLTIPKFELSGALLLTKLMKHVIEAMKMEYEQIFLWTDSKVVLGWINGNPRRWKTFVANKITKINDTMNKNDWRHVASEDNPADCASRGIYPSEIKAHRLWWNGPNWLAKNKNEYPKNDSFDTTLELKALTTKVQIHEPLLTKNAALTYFKLVRIIALCFRFSTNCKNKNKNTDPLSTEEMCNASNAIIKLIQGENFADEINDLRNRKSLNKNSDVIKLRPFIDEKGILRVGGRIQRSYLPYDAKHQILLPNKDWITELIVKMIHEQTIHGGPRLTEATLREKYWIPQGYRTIKRIIHECFICRRYDAKGLHQIMGNLPTNRVRMARAFSNCGVDYAGPISVRMSKGRGSKTFKSYISLFVCLATKAIHLELVSDLTAEAFIAAFRRFTARRGNVAHMYSDNGTNFVKANKILQINDEKAEKAYNQKIYNELNENSTHWHFIPPGTPHFGGLWEAGVKSVKNHLKRAIGESTLTFEELTTLLYQIEACLNSRPLCPMSTEPDDTDILTPGHFLIGAALKAPPDENISDVKTNHLNRWQMVQKMYQQFWNKWSTEYLNRLQERPKWLNEKSEPELNELIIIRDENMPPTRWATARILQKHPGRDDKTRVVTVKNNDKLKQYPLHKISRLPMGQQRDVENKIRGILNTKGSTSTKCKTVLPIITALLACVISGTQTMPINETAIENMPFTHKPGIYFEEKGIAYMSNTNWNIIAYYDLKNFVKEFKTLQLSIKLIKDLCENSDVDRTSCNNTIAQLEMHINEIEAKNQILMKNKSRRKRATLDFMGNILGDVFGVLDSRFNDKYANDISKIMENEDYVLALLKNHTSIAETTINIIKKDEKEIQKQYARISNMTAYMKNLTDREQIDHRLITTSFHILNTIMKYEKIQDEILDVLLDAHNSRVTTDILSPDQLIQQINTIEKQVDTSILVPGGNTHDTLRSIYSIMSISAKIMDEKIIFAIKLPLLMNEQFQIYRPIAVPTIQGNKYVWIEPSMAYLFATRDRNHYYAMTENEFDQCIGYIERSVICIRKRQLFNLQSTTNACEIKLINHNKQIDNGCTIKFTPIKPIWIPISNKNEWIYIIHEEYPIDIMCNQQRQHTELRGEGIIRLRQKCSIQHASMEIAAQNDIETTLTQSVLPHVNISDEIMKYTAYGPVQAIEEIDTFSTKSLEEMIRIQRNHEQRLPNDLNELNHHDIHHYGLGYLSFSIIFIVTMYKIHQRYRKWKENRMPPSRPNIIRSISMPIL